MSTNKPTEVANEDSAASRVLALVCHMFDYVKSDGVLLWRNPSKFHRRLIGTVAGSKNDPKGYVYVFVEGKSHAVHRLVWLLETGRFPEHNIDHINGVRNDNRFCNLRDVPQQMNLQNFRNPTSKNSTGFLGVGYSKRHGSYRARISVDGKDKYIGQFKTPEEAHEAYLRVKRRLHACCEV